MGQGLVLSDDERLGNEVDADTADAFDFDDDAAVALDALDDAFHAGEGS